MKIIGADERLAEKSGPKILVVGPSGVGKTSLLPHLHQRDVGLDRGLRCRGRPLGWLNQLQHARERTVIFVAVLEKNIDDFNITTWQPQIEGGKTGRELPAIVDEIITMTWIDFGDRKPVRAFVCTNPNPWGYPAKDRSGRLEQLEPPNLGALITKLIGPEQRKPFKIVSPEQTAQT